MEKNKFSDGDIDMGKNSMFARIMSFILAAVMVLGVVFMVAAYIMN